MIRFLQSEGQTKKYVLGGLLLLICLSMVAYLTQGISSSGGLAGSTKGVVATVGSDQITAQEVKEQGRAMLRQQFPRGNAMAERGRDNLLREHHWACSARRTPNFSRFAQVASTCTCYLPALTSS